MISGQAYFGRITHGAEQLAWHDIRRRFPAELLHTYHRTLVFRSPADPSELLTLRSLEDLFVLAAAVRGIGHTRAALEVIRQGASKLSLQEALWSLRRVRELPESVRFAITASFVGKRNYNRWEIAEELRAGLRERYDWEYIETRDRPFQPHDLHLRAVLEDDFMLLGVRLAARPLGDRNYKTSHLPGSLNPPLAYLMSALAEVPAGGTLLDPMCGAGTIPIEAALARKEIKVIGGDQSEQALAVCAENVAGELSHLSLRRLDAAALDFEDSSIAAVVSDLPWGRQTEIKAAGGQGYGEILREFNRVLRPDGKMVLLTEREELLMSAVAPLPLAPVQIIPVSLYGRRPVIYLIARA